MAGKGDKRRPESNTFNDNWDRIFGTKTEDIDTSDVEPFHIKNAKHLKMQDLEYKEKMVKRRFWVKRMDIYFVLNHFSFVILP